MPHTHLPAAAAPPPRGGAPPPGRRRAARAAAAPADLQGGREAGGGAIGAGRSSQGAGASQGSGWGPAGWAARHASICIVSPRSLPPTRCRHNSAPLRRCHHHCCCLWRYLPPAACPKAVGAMQFAMRHVRRPPPGLLFRMWAELAGRAGHAAPAPTTGVPEPTPSASRCSPWLLLPPRYRATRQTTNTTRHAPARSGQDQEQTCDWQGARFGRYCARHPCRLPARTCLVGLPPAFSALIHGTIYNRNQRGRNACNGASDRGAAGRQ